MSSVHVIFDDTETPTWRDFCAVCLGSPDSNLTFDYFKTASVDVAGDGTVVRGVNPWDADDD